MNFNSLSFIVYLLIVVCLYYILPYKYRNGWLLIASYYFYMCWNVKYSLLMLSTTLVAYYGAILMDRSKKLNKRLILVITIAILILILGIFKYYNFIMENFNSIITKVGFSSVDVYFDILLPVGISFYVIQAMGYVLDVYRGTVPAEGNLTHFMLFISFFPQLVAGPIEKAKNMFPQFREKHVVNIKNISDGLRLILFGLFKKIAIADVCALYVDVVYEKLYLYNGITIIVAAGLFMIQIYGDFSGYSDIARGSGKLLGFQLMENFKAPYFSSSPSDFWRRWHISLSQWLRDYIYIPLGGSRRGNVYMNVMIIFLISGLWHGASYKYIYWGGYGG